MCDSIKNNQGGESLGVSVLRSVLTPRMIRTCALVWLERKTHRQAAELHGITPAAVGKRLQRARRRLEARGLPVPRPGPALRLRAIAGLEGV